MPERPAADGAHTAFTDHRIARPNATPPRGAAEPALKAWREPAGDMLRRRNAGLALIAAARIQEGFRLLREVFPAYERDPEVLTATGTSLYLKDQYTNSLKLLEAAAVLRPHDAALRERIAVVHQARGAREAAIIALEKAIELDPALESAYHRLHAIAPEKRALDRYLRLFPGSLIAREALRR
jgi:tetratricopeptide (TPR) repeat protein